MNRKSRYRLHAIGNGTNLALIGLTDVADQNAIVLIRAVQTTRSRLLQYRPIDAVTALQPEKIRPLKLFPAAPRFHLLLHCPAKAGNMLTAPLSLPLSASILRCAMARKPCTSSPGRRS